MESRTVAERLLALEDGIVPSLGSVYEDRARREELAAIRAEVEAVAKEMREYETPQGDQLLAVFADRLAKEKP